MLRPQVSQDGRRQTCLQFRDDGTGMRLKVRKSSPSGRVAIPASKSHTIRAVAIASLAKGISTIRRPLVSSDTLSTVTCYGQLGASIDTSNENAWVVTGTGGRIQTPSDVIDVGNSGTTLRLALGSAALAEPGEKITFTGDSQIQARPLQPLMVAINTLGGRCHSVRGNGMAPVEVEGKLHGGKVSIECKTSQYLSSLLAATPLAQGDSEIEVTLLNEPDYVQMTLDWLDEQGIKYENNALQWFRIKGGQSYKAFDRSIPADFSSATFFLCAAAMLGSEITLEGLDFGDSQPDKAVAEYLKQMGAKVRVEGDEVTIKGAGLRGVEIDMNKTPDALPAMAVAAAMAEGMTRLVNVPQARLKETDRIACMAQELGKIGIRTEELADGLVVYGGKPHAAAVDGRSDHRIVMALAIAGLAMEGETVIDTAEAMSVTFPTFVELMQDLGADMEVVE
jgi:3-phosphoshikimate 1-carboxyvinyltransferase